MEKLKVMFLCTGNSCRKVFKSGRGSAYVPNSWRDLFAVFRVDAKVPGVEWNQIRDAAYTAACDNGVPFHLAQILAGHQTSSGESDKYIARNPKMIQPATDAIYAAYMGKAKKPKLAKVA